MASRREALKQLGSDFKFFNKFEQDAQEEEKELKRADQVLEKLVEQDTLNEKLDEDMLDDLQKAMQAFEDAKQHTQHIEQLISEADNPFQAMQILQEDDKDVSAIRNDIKNAHDLLMDFNQDLAKKEKLMKQEEQEEATLEDLSEALSNHLSEMKEMHEALMDKMQSQEETL